MMISKIKNRSTKAINKVRRKKVDVPIRITNDTIDVHREHVLSGGRKFKYPMQYAKHKLVYNALIILGQLSLCSDLSLGGNYIKQKLMKIFSIELPQFFLFQ